MGSSDLQNLWKAKSFQPECHIDFDCIIGNKKTAFLKATVGSEYFSGDPITGLAITGYACCISSL